MPPIFLVDMTELDKFIDIFGGSFSAYGQTRKTNEFDDRGKHKSKSFIIKQTPTTKMFEEHLEGKDPALGIIPINEQNKCRWACIDIDLYNGFDHKALITKIKKHNFPLTVCRSKSGGAHVFLFTKDYAKPHRSITFYVASLKFYTFLRHVNLHADFFFYGKFT